jgi:hypothetical protein
MITMKQRPIVITQNIRKYSKEKIPPLTHMEKKLKKSHISIGSN